MWSTNIYIYIYIFFFWGKWSTNLSAYRILATHSVGYMLIRNKIWI